MTMIVVNRLISPDASPKSEAIVHQEYSITKYSCFPNNYNSSIIDRKGGRSTKFFL